MQTHKVLWPAPSHISALSTTRSQGHSQPPYDNNNLALHVGDDERHVLSNRAQLRQHLLLHHEPVWLNQSHSTRCILAEEDNHREADAAVTRSPHYPLVILTADCLPILLCDKAGTEIAAIHAGWKGLCQGIVENTLQKMQSKPLDLLAWIGPAICGQCYQVDEARRLAFLKQYPFLLPCFTALPEQQYLAHLPAMAEMILQQCGISSVFQSNQCTYEAVDQYYSYRRAAITGRIGTFIWFNNAKGDLHATT